MRVIILACVIGLVVLAALVLSGAMAAADLTHPFWQTKASVTGAIAGTTISAGLIWITNYQRVTAARMAIFMGIALTIALVVTWRAARIFIDSADYEPAAGQLWYFGYHAVAATVVASVALSVVGLRRG